MLVTQEIAGLNPAPVAMKQILILEDSEERMKFFRTSFIGHQIQHFEHVDDALKAAASTNFDLLMLDHDLDGLVYVEPTEYNCGTTFVSLLEAPRLIASKALCVVHSHNSPAATRMTAILKAKGYNAVKHSFADIRYGKIKINL